MTKVEDGLAASIQMIIKYLKNDIVHELDKEKVIAIVWELEKSGSLEEKTITNSTAVISELSQDSQEFLAGTIKTIELIYPMIRGKRLTT